MKVSLQWLEEVIGASLDAEAVAHLLTMGGLEVEHAEPVAGLFDKVVVAQVLSVAPHPNADKLRVTSVDVGSGAPLQIVCGAPNVAAGQRVPCALIGATLGSGPGALAIKAAKLRGVESSGMLCSARELGLSEDHSGLMELPADAPVGADIREYLQLSDTLLTLKLTPNRGDCLSTIGVARDLAVLMGRPLPALAAPPVVTAIADKREIRIAEPTACGHYAGRVIRGLNPSARTPDWMTRRLERAGLRPKNPLVDITNYVMLECGQPLHAFDQDKLSGAITVRHVRPSEEFILLNEQKADPIPGLLVIADESGPQALAGIMGGQASMVSEATTSVFLESAFFAPSAIQGRAKALMVTSDAAYRFERGVDFAGAKAALERASALVLEICGGAAGPVTEARGELPARPPVRVRPERVRALLGYEVADADMHTTLGRLGCTAAPRDGEFVVVAPTWRFDLDVEADFVEEIARVQGYERVPASVPRSSVPMPARPEGRRDALQLKQAAVALGYQEVICYSFVPAAWEQDFSGNGAPVRLANPIASTMDVMRSSLAGGLVDVVRTNLNRGAERVKAFELGRCFLGSEASDDDQPERIGGIAYGSRLPEQWGAGGEATDFFDVKGDVESLVGPVRIQWRPAQRAACHPGRCAEAVADGKVIGWVGELHPAWQQKYDLPKPAVLFELDSAALLASPTPSFSGVSRMPRVRRDLAVLVPARMPVGDILTALREAAPVVVQSLEVFDQYQGRGVPADRKSLAFRVVMQDTSRTLTDAEIDAVVSSLLGVLSDRFEAELRS